MDSRFHPAIAAIKAGDVERLRTLVREDPTLATGRSSCSHPTLLQCLVLEAKDVPNQLEMARVLVDAGADIDDPLGGCASIDNAGAASALLDAGAEINGRGGWSPLEEALYWNNREVIDLLLRRGASVHNLRIAAGLGRTDVMEDFFNADGTLKPEAGKIAWPFGDPEISNLAPPVKKALQAGLAGWTHSDREIINNAFIYACIHNRLEAADLLLAKGAEINAIPPGFDYAGTGLHYAALNGHREMVDFLLERGADPTIRDPKVNNLPAGWAEYGGHPALKEHLERAAAAP